MAPAPAEVKHAEDAIMEGDSKMYKIIPSKSALNDASALNLNVAQGDVPLFVADRLAFAGSKGAQVHVHSYTFLIIKDSYSYNISCLFLLASTVFGKGRLYG
jgi:hypothetical protein